MQATTFSACLEQKYSCRAHGHSTHSSLTRQPLMSSMLPTGGFPITLRHRLHATIVRRASTPCAPHSSSKFAAHTAGSSSGSDLMPAVSRNCTGNVVYGEEHVALNEVVIERGISPFLTNLECFCDGGFVTHVQVSTNHTLAGTADSACTKYSTC